MSRENVHLVEAGLRAFNGRDGDGFASLTTDDFVWVPALAGTVEQSVYEGRAGIDRYFAETAATWEELTVLGDELRDFDDSVLLLGRAVGRGLGSGAPVEMPLAFIAEFREGRLAKVSAYLSHHRALAAAGLGA
jgi:ketosteroid isomerase-like protein